jgi:hypothetical protein
MLQTKGLSYSYSPPASSTSPFSSSSPSSSSISLLLFQASSCINQTWNTPVLHQPSSLLQGLPFFSPPHQLLHTEFPFNPWPFSSPQPLNSFPRVPVAIHPN